MEFCGGEWKEFASSPATNFLSLVFEVASVEQGEESLQVRTVRYWSMPECQVWQQKYRPKIASGNDEENKGKNAKKRVNKTIDNSNQNNKETARHGGNKREKGECVAEFLIKVVMLSIQRKQGGGSKEVENLEDTAASSADLRQAAIDRLNTGTGVIDAAGGVGYVSMALGMNGVKSTIVDPRDQRLPRRDRKEWNKMLRGVPPKSNGNQEEPLLCQPIVPYDSLRAWFAKPPPENVDTAFRHGDVDSIPVCDERDELLLNCSAIVALHPDEATDVIVDMALKRRIPFVVVPCCVFSRFFTYRRKMGTDLPVTTYEDLLDYLCSKDDSIQRTTLPFTGLNVALWSIF